MYLDVSIVLPLTYEFVGFGSFIFLLFLKLLVHLKTKAFCLRNVVFVKSVTMENVQIHMSDPSRVTPLSQNYSVHLKVLCFKTFITFLHPENLRLLYSGYVTIHG
jgi:hypothetical protein